MVCEAASVASASYSKINEVGSIDTLAGATSSSGVQEMIANADLMIVAGTSLMVQPASGLLNYFKGNNLVLINRDTTPYDNIANLVINESLGKVFKNI